MAPRDLSIPGLTPPIRRAAAAALLAACAGSASAQSDPEAVRRLERQLREFDMQYRVSISPDQPISERLLVDYGGSLRFGFYTIDDAESKSHILYQYDARAYLRLELDGAHRIFIRGKGQYDDWERGDSFDGRGSRWNNPGLDRAFYQFDLRGLERAQTGVAPDYNFNAKIGKQYVVWGSGLTLSNTMWAGLLDAEYGTLGFTALGGVTAPRDVIDFDGSRPGFDSFVRRVYAGFQFEYRGLTEHRPYAFFLSQLDSNRESQKFQNVAGLFPTTFGYDSYYLGFGSKGDLSAEWTYRAEFVKQFGVTFSNSFDPATALPVNQTRNAIDAYAGLLGLTYLFRDPGDTRLDFELVGGSGDSDRLSANDTFGGNAPGTTDRAFNALGYVNTGVALAADVSNLLSFRGGFSTTPFRQTQGVLGGLRTGVDGFLFTKIDKNAPLSIATTPGEQFLGGEIDLFLDWRLTSDLNATLRYGVFLPNTDAFPRALDNPRHFLYLGVTYAF